MNKALFALLLGAFALGSAEFGTVGLIPSLTHQLHRDSDELGWLVAIYAIGVTIGAPVLTRLLQRYDTRLTLAVSMAAAGALTVLASMSEHFGLLLAARLLLGANHGLFFSLAMPLAGRLSPRSTIEGMAQVISGLTIAIVLSIPIMGFVSDHYRWQVTFWLLGGAYLIAAAAMWRWIPAQAGARTLESQQVRFAEVISNPRVLSALMKIVLLFGGYFIAYTYLPKLIIDSLGYSQDTANFLLLLFGVGVVLGNHFGGIAAARYGVSRTIGFNYALIAALLVAIYFLIGLPSFAYAGILLLGLFAMSSTPSLGHYGIEVSRRLIPGSTEIASSLTVSGYNIGIALGSLIGGVVLRQVGLNQVLVVAAAVIGLGLVVNFLEHRADRRLDMAI
ncbi:MULTISPECIES: MFS transporter [Lysobacter]|uniref:MFS transporter n=1 Tax=Lysobacter TaxID=68 RepID=UPI001F2774F3|nr:MULTISPECIES: MFS transporter [Lysobacter]UJB17770.1 MFS transporter [Lysobacter capsici]UJQ28508.1 MFS transporter [Lysobacter gummosus]